ncbi:MAG: hypothetical protein LBI63_04725 [Candidatus Ancillula sp.]|jgi:pyrroline-5-carboxylate reductase|nr:hypothetical protein [Candidatus Ancillula sp.]
MCRKGSITIIGKGVIGEIIGNIIDESPDEYTTEYITREETPEEREAKLKEADVVFIAVKPKDLDGILDELGAYAKDGAVLCTLVAGVKSDVYAKKLGDGIKLVRVIPTTTIKVGSGICSITKTLGATDADVDLIKHILYDAGLFISLEESKLDGFTAVVGCSPAYFFRFSKVLYAAAKKFGLNDLDAKFFISQTLTGAGLAYLGDPGHDNDKELDDLIAEVASKGGATEKALAIFDSSDFNNIVENAIGSAYKSLHAFV